MPSSACPIVGEGVGLLRILLAVCVFCAHSRPLGNLHWLGGNLAVELFFVISGFYMQLVLSTRYTRARLGNGWIFQFYKARYFRLFPIYMLCCLFVLGAALIRPSSGPLQIWRLVWSLPDAPGNLFSRFFLCFTNLTMIFQDWAMFLAVHGSRIHWSANFSNSEAPLWQGLAIPQAWSLGLELSFYLLAPCLLNLRSRWLFLGAGCSLAIKLLVISELHLGDPWTYRFFPFELGYFLLGSLACRYRNSFDCFVPEHIDKYRFYVYPLVIGFAAVRVHLPVATLVYPVVLACALPFVFKTTSQLKADRLIGELSYPFYIFHWFALTLATFAGRHWWRGSTGSIVWIGLGLTLVLSAVGLALEFRFIEPWRARLAEGMLPAPRAKPSDRVQAPAALSPR